MSQVSVLHVTTKAQQKQFLELPWKIYAGNQYWVPPLRMDQKEMVGYAKHPFYINNVAQTFLAFRDGEAVGRISAIINKDHNERHKEQRGFFGFFEVVNDSEVATKLFDAASVLMLDFVGFTQMAVSRDPNALITELNDIFTAFDRIVDTFNCERIKTLGDAYIAVCGLPE